MLRMLRGLVACLSLLAYLLSHTHVNLALARCTFPSKSSSRAETETGQKAAPRCLHCHHRGASADVRPGGKTQEQDHDSSAPRCPSDPSCPCCPSDQSNCPVPGGCALCSISKAPCVTSLPLVEPFAGPT